ncbi:MAG: hypothetical protein WDO74_09510 [Pseudomonadota bacterium]
MQLSSGFSPVGDREARSAPAGAPEWLVCNGGVTVGPVRTELLLRGVIHGRVPSSAWVRQTGWQNWRELGKIREVSALTRVLERRVDEPTLEPGSLQESVEAIAQAADAGEALLIALQAAVRATSATVGLAHRVREPLLLPTTSCLFEASSERLGEVLPWFDPAFALARTGRGASFPRLWRAGWGAANGLGSAEPRYPAGGTRGAADHGQRSTVRDARARA